MEKRELGNLVSLSQVERQVREEYREDLELARASGDIQREMALVLAIRHEVQQRVTA